MTPARLGFLLGFFVLGRPEAIAGIGENFPLSAGIAFPSASDAVRYNASEIALRDKASAEVIGGVPIADGEKTAAIGTLLGHSGSLGGGLGAEWWNPTPVLRGSAAYRFGQHASGFTLGASVRFFREVVDDTSSGAGGAGGDPGASIEKQSFDADLSAMYRSGNVRLATVLHSLKNKVSMATLGGGVVADPVYAELDVEWTRNEYNDVFFLGGIGARLDPVSFSLRYYLGYMIGEDGLTRQWIKGQTSVGAAFQLTRSVLLEALYKYDPITYNVGVKYEF